MSQSGFVTKGSCGAPKSLNILPKAVTVPGAIEVIDGDTIRAHGVVFRLVGLDAPETGFRARCEAERTGFRDLVTEITRDKGRERTIGRKPPKGPKKHR
jgi:hypothetical protein